MRRNVLFALFFATLAYCCDPRGILLQSKYSEGSLINKTSEEVTQILGKPDEDAPIDERRTRFLYMYDSGALYCAIEFSNGRAVKVTRKLRN
jgi:hypothetical protein